MGRVTALDDGMATLTIRLDPVVARMLSIRGELPSALDEEIRERLTLWAHAMAKAVVAEAKRRQADVSD